MGLHLPPSIASCLTVGFIIFLFRRDIRQKPDVSGAASVEEGSPLDAWFFFALIAAGSCVLVKRQVSVSEVIQNNGWVIVFLFYCFIAIAWSDFPSVAF